MRGFDPVVLQEKTISYPEVAGLSKGIIWVDAFNRTTLNPTGAIAIYATSTDSTGTVAIMNQQLLRVLTAALAGDQSMANVTELVFERTQELDLRNEIELDIIFQMNTNVTSGEIFIGLMDSQVTLTAIPTTQNYMGLLIDKSVAATMKLVGGDGVAQTETDTGVTLAASTKYTLNIIWDGLNSATLNLYSGSDHTTLLATAAVTALGSIKHLIQTFYANGEAVAAVDLRIISWGYETR